MKKALAAQHEYLVESLNSRTLPILKELCREERAQAEASNGWSAKEKEFHIQCNVLEEAKIRAVQIIEINGRVLHVGSQKTALERKVEEWLHWTPGRPWLFSQGQQNTRGPRGQSRAGRETVQTVRARRRAALELKEMMRRQREDPDGQTV